MENNSISIFLTQKMSYICTLESKNVKFIKNANHDYLEQM